jgi:hypothetical protein
LCSRGVVPAMRTVDPELPFEIGPMAGGLLPEAVFG